MNAPCTPGCITERKKEDIQAVLDDGKYAVMSLDMCGAIAMKRHFPTAIIYVAKDKEDMIADIVQSDFSVGEENPSSVVTGCGETESGDLRFCY